MKLDIKQYLYLLWLAITFRGYKLNSFYYYSENCGMAQVIAYKKALLITKIEYNAIKHLIKFNQRK